MARPDDSARVIYARECVWLSVGAVRLRAPPTRRSRAPDLDAVAGGGLHKYLEHDLELIQPIHVVESRNN